MRGKQGPRAPGSTRRATRWGPRGPSRRAGGCLHGHTVHCTETLRSSPWTGSGVTGVTEHSSKQRGSIQSRRTSPCENVRPAGSTGHTPAFRMGLRMDPGLPPRPGQPPSLDSGLPGSDAGKAWERAHAENTWRKAGEAGNTGCAPGKGQNW